ncbi:DUF3231 family protein [Paenibacillus athensensis]|uniref:DUF3231 family protein n=1 Tax=Paenibacillus athensensis TaxID=1967502 RepID=A0A4Y8Q6Q2_9BACL|nr:DUF3231 family protein [Paenibacillus athensensis]MCD1259483.1 DUF3231 family protein [Paenibacillus athensensis]
MSEIRMPISATELATVWMAYQEKTLMLQFMKIWLEKAEDPQAKDILQQAYTHLLTHLQRLKGLFQSEDAVLPVGFDESDIVLGVPRLFDPHFDLMWLRAIAKVEIGLYGLHSSMSYREDVRSLQTCFTQEAQEIYNRTTDYLLRANILVRPPYISMPVKVEFVKDKNYMSGFNWFTENRPLNAIEIAHLYQAVETNIIGIQMMNGFAQAAAHQDVREYFQEGATLAQKIVSNLSEVLTKSDIQPPASWLGKATTSTVSPFSDKLMMYLTSLLTNFGLGSSVIGSAFSLRSDLPARMMMLGKDIMFYAKKGGKIMTEHGWMEEPPQSENRKNLIQNKS